MDGCAGFECVAPSGPAALQPYRAREGYLLIDERECHHAVQSGSKANFAALLFRIENCRTTNELSDLLGASIEELMLPENDSLQRAFKTWFEATVLPRFRGVRTTVFHNLREMHSMLAQTIERWKLEWWEEGRQKGREEGFREGERKGEVHLLLCLLRRRFGQLPSWAIARVEAATTEELTHWGEKLFEIETLAALLRDDARLNGR